MFFFVPSFPTAVISAIAVINEAVDRGDANGTLQSLQVEAAKLSAVHPHNAQLYQKVLAKEKSSKAQVRGYVHFKSLPSFHPGFI